MGDLRGLGPRIFPDEHGACGQGHTGHRHLSRLGGVEGEREQCQRLAGDWSKRKKSSSLQDLSREGPSGKAPRKWTHSCQANETATSSGISLFLHKHRLVLLSIPNSQPLEELPEAQSPAAPPP